MIKRRVAYKKLIPTFLDGKYKDYTLEQLCKKFRISISYLKRLLGTGVSLESALLIKHNKSKFSASEIEELESLGVIFTDVPDISKTLNEQLETFRDGRYKGYALTPLLKEMGFRPNDYSYVRIKIQMGYSLEQIFEGYPKPKSITINTSNKEQEPKSFTLVESEKVDSYIINPPDDLKNKMTELKTTLTDSIKKEREEEINEKKEKAFKSKYKPVEYYMKENIFKRIIRAIFNLY